MKKISNICLLLLLGGVLSSCEPYHPDPNYHRDQARARRAASETAFQLRRGHGRPADYPEAARAATTPTDFITPTTPTPAPTVGHSH